MGTETTSAPSADNSTSGAAAHTPGPWQVTNGTDVFTALGAARADGLAADRNDGWHIADCSMGFTFVEGLQVEMSRQEQRANARLIASAPALLDALQDIVQGGLSTSAIAKARAAIALARGGAQ